MRTRRLPDPADTWTDDEARSLLSEWERSGDSIAAFARERGLAASRLYWWRARLRSSSPTPSAGTLSLVPASILVNDVTVAIRLPDGISVEVANASPRWVAAIVDELARRRP